ncbi:MAG: GIY-YIG nuclease family protein [Lawsonibacter sp.]|jgi:predicted GIY-YIG superfamily endonuclease|nr:GIY-YIG nuclease family protein [Lawsonibacter sp.]
MFWYVYMLRCGDGTLYTGVTDDVERRLAAHRAGKGAKYTRGRGPLELVYQEQVPDKSAALRREYQIKRLPKQEKEGLIAKK